MPEYKVIPKQFPMQMLKWTDVGLKKVILLWGTTCMYVFSNGYDIDVYKDILYKYGILHKNAGMWKFMPIWLMGVAPAVKAVIGGDKIEVEK